MADQFKIYRVCPGCNGDGVIEDTWQGFEGGPPKADVACSFEGCNGTGYIEVGRIVEMGVLDDIKDKVDDVMDKCNDIMEKLNE